MLFAAADFAAFQSVITGDLLIEFVLQISERSLRSALFPKLRRTDLRLFELRSLVNALAVFILCLNGGAFFVSEHLAVRAFGIHLFSSFIDDGEIVQLQVRRGLVQMHGSRQDIPIGTVIADLAFQKGVTVRKELLQFQREGLAGNIAAFLEESLVARDNDALEGDGFLCFLKGRVTQQEIARRLHLDQATVSRRLEKIYVRLDLMRLHDGERSPKELAFEVAWEEFLRAGHMRGDADVRAFAFFLRAQGELLALLYKWFFTPGELLRYAARYLMVGGTETKGELLEQLSSYGQAFFARQKFADEVEEKLCLRLLREVERRAATIPEPSGSAFHRYEEEIKELAHRRRLSYTFYFEEILMRKYEFKRICKTLSYAKRIAARMRNAAQKAALRREIAILDVERVALQRLLSRLAARYAVRYEGEGKLGINS